MPRPVPREGDWDDDEPDWSGADDDFTDASGDAGEATVACPYCRRPVHEDSPRCPYCGQYISREDAPPARKPWWIVIGVLLALYVVFRWIVPR
jgi:hypothetical protein